ncbi:MAG: hypothetical protein FJY92_09855, partial [Candidatus Hydrogenedentes bacterium]|nr:hypothetical protein [Candidatus Hydrogenedentota bacterium]
REAKLCADTGLPASRWCRHVATASLPDSQFLNRRCDVHYPREDGGEGVTQRWPASAKGWDLAKVDASVDVSPGDAARKAGLRILSPANNAEFVLAGEPNSDRIRLRSSADDSAEIHWYLDGQHVGVTDSKRSVLLSLDVGTHSLACMTTGGAKDTVAFSVVEPTRGLGFSQTR